MNSPSANSRVSPGRNGKNSPHSTKTMIDADPDEGSAEPFEQPVGVEVVDARQQGQQVPGEVHGRQRNGRSQGSWVACRAWTQPARSEDERAPYDPMPYGQPEVGVGPWEGPRPDGRAVRRRRCSPTATGATSSTATATGRLEAIVADLDTRRHDFHVAIENWQHDFNIGTIVRTANAFLAAEVHIVGNRRWNRRGAMVTDRYQHVRHHASVADLAAYLRSLPASRSSCGGSTTCPAPPHLETTELPRRVCFLFGQEGPGPLGRRPRGVRRHVLDRPVRLDPLDQRLGGRGDRDARLGPHARGPLGRGRLAGLVHRDRESALLSNRCSIMMTMPRSPLTVSIC